MIYKYITYIDFFIWTLPLIKQYKGGYFMYFLIIALTPFLAIAGYYYFRMLPFTFFVISSAAIIIPLQYYKNKRIWLGIVLMVLLVPLAIYLNDYKYSLFINIILRCLILGYFIFFMLKFMYLKKSANFYFIILIIYEVSLILKMAAGIISFPSGATYYYLTSVFEFLICVYFIFYNIENSPQFRFQKI
jgi:hypothetical protein